MSMAAAARSPRSCWPCMQVRVEAGCRVQQVADVLKRHGLSLANYASIREQQIGGFTQVRCTCQHPTHCCGALHAGWSV